MAEEKNTEEKKSIWHDLCGDTFTVTFGGHHWILVCNQDVGHDGPHVGAVTWRNSHE